MEDDPVTKDARLPGEKREVFLSRLLVQLMDYLIEGGDRGDIIALRDALADDFETHQRQGRARPGGRV